MDNAYIRVAGVGRDDYGAAVGAKGATATGSLDFHLLFFSKNIFRIHKVKSDIRRIICKKFEENNIIIAFPQLDVHLKSSEK